MDAIRVPLRVLLAALLLLVGVRSVPGQTAGPDSAAPGAPASLSGPGAGTRPDTIAAVVPTPRRAAIVTDAGRAFLYSAVLPGSGQLYLGVNRWVPYAAAEALFWVTYLEHRNRGQLLDARYRDLAWAVARRVSVGTRIDGDWDYYEAMGKYHASGVFDADPRTSGIQPERDPTTYNGMIWNLARGLHLPGGAEGAEGSPHVGRALAYYEQRAVRPEMAWSWGDNGLERQVFKDLISTRDEAVRAATRALGLILANHVVAAVDALIVARLREELHLRHGWNVEGSIEPDPELNRWWAGVRIAWPGK